MGPALPPCVVRPRPQCRAITAESIRHRGLNAEVRGRIPGPWLSRPQMGADLAHVTAQVARCARDRDVAGAFKLLGEVDSLNVIVHNAVLSACAKAYDCERAQELWATMPEKSVVSYNTMIRICGAALKASVVDDLWEEMQQSGVEPDVFTYTALIKAYAQSEQVEKALDMLNRMRSVSAPDAVAFAAAMSACARAGDYARARELFVEMLGAGIPPNNFHVNSLLTACAKRGDAAVAEALFKMMPTYNLVPTEKDYCVLMACCRHDAQRCREVMQELRQSRVEPDALTLQNMITVEVDAGNQGEAALLLAEVRRRSLRMTPMLERIAHQLEPV